MMKNSLLAALIAIIAAYCTVKLALPKGVGVTAKETAYERVLRTGVLRCGYWNWPPLVEVNANTKELSGIMKEYTDALGEVLNIKVEWTEELGFADFFLAIQNNRVDAMCAGVWPMAERARVMEFTEPVFFIPMHFYVKADDARFDGNIQALNQPGIKFSTMDGLVADMMLRKYYPQAEVMSITAANSVGETFDMIAAGKVDATLNDVIVAQNYMAANPGKIKEVTWPYPVTFFGNTIAVGKDEWALKRMLDIATDQLEASGAIEQLVRKYERFPDTLYLPAKPYQALGQKNADEK
ncbi:MAG: transporter substrate-binding domain-containing protein [Alphaproteobacteria bacterium]